MYYVRNMSTASLASGSYETLEAAAQAAKNLAACPLNAGCEIQVLMHVGLAKCSVSPPEWRPVGGAASAPGAPTGDKGLDEMLSATVEKK